MGRTGFSLILLASLVCLISANGRLTKRKVEIGRAQGGLIGSFFDGKGSGVLLRSRGGANAFIHEPKFNAEENFFNDGSFGQRKFGGKVFDDNDFKGEFVDFGSINNFGSQRFDSGNAKNVQQSSSHISSPRPLKEGSFTQPPSFQSTKQFAPEVHRNINSNAGLIEGSFKNRNVHQIKRPVKIPGRIIASADRKSNIETSVKHDQQVHSPNEANVHPSQSISEQDPHGLADAHLITGVGGLSDKVEVHAKTQLGRAVKGGRFDIGSLGNSLVDQALKETEGGQVLNSFWKDGQLHTTIVIEEGFDESQLGEDEVLLSSLSSKEVEDITSLKQSFAQEENLVNAGIIRDSKTVNQGTNIPHSNDRFQPSVAPKHNFRLASQNKPVHHEPIKPTAHDFNSHSTGSQGTKIVKANALRFRHNDLVDHRPKPSSRPVTSTRVTHNSGFSRRPSPRPFFRPTFRGERPRGFGATSFVSHRFAGPRRPGPFSFGRSPFSPLRRPHREISDDNKQTSQQIEEEEEQQE